MCQLENLKPKFNQLREEPLPLRKVWNWGSFFFYLMAPSFSTAENLNVAILASLLLHFKFAKLLMHIPFFYIFSFMLRISLALMWLSYSVVSFIKELSDMCTKSLSFLDLGHHNQSLF